MKGTQSEFARHIGKSRQYVSKIDKQGRLVKDLQGKVDFEKSIKRIADTADPSKIPEARMTMTEEKPKAKRKKEKAIVNQMDLDDDKDAEDDEPQLPISGVTHRFQSSRADKEDAAAKLKQIEYERELGKIVYREDVAKYIGKAIKITRDKLLAIPTRLAPRVTVESDQKNNFAIITKEIEDVIKEIQQGLADFRS